MFTGWTWFASEGHRLVLLIITNCASSHRNYAKAFKAPGFGSGSDLTPDSCSDPIGLR